MTDASKTGDVSAASNTGDVTDVTNARDVTEASNLQVTLYMSMYIYIYSK